MIRQPIVSVLGHVDHGKTTLLDTIRGSAVAEREAGGITQHIGATEIPMSVIEKLCGGLLKQLAVKITLPGLLFIDTPGHEAFTTLRKRGGALADLAILVVDVNEGFQAQTLEALNVLKTYKTPFLVAANKIDKIKGWQVFKGFPFTHSFSKQDEETKSLVENEVYELVGKLYEEGFQSERFDRVTQFEKQVAVIPVSAKTGEGIPELLMMLIGLAQKFMEKRLEVEIQSPAKGTILEVKEEVGLGVTVDAIIYDGKIKRGDAIAVGGRKEVIVTKVRSLLKPKPLDEIRDPRFKFNPVSEAHAACGIKIAAPNLEDALAGSPIRVVGEDLEKGVAEVKAEIAEIKVETEKAGVVVKADTLGSLEALINMLEKESIPVRKADVGDVSRRDIVEAEAVRGEDRYKAVVLGFNVKVLKDAEERARATATQIFQNNVIYRLIEDYQKWIAEEKEREKREEFDKITKPAKIKILPHYVFRTSKPAIVGIEVLAGTIRTNVKLMNEEGGVIGTVKGLQDRNENIEEARKGRQVAIAIDGATVGRQIKENDILYSELQENEVKLIEKYRKNLSPDEEEAFEEIKKIRGD
ncbi:MAG: translation initiation factor IF-2 [Euryarchaeota archaeon]|nr:translation initiation factor IF-2 [Euryarchaeota archaeon]